MNTRLQVEHPVTEEVSGIDLVREMFRIADGQPLGYDDPPVRGHSIEFRINAEDPGRHFLPAPGTISRWRPPSGPGVRLDAGYAAGLTVPQAFDSLIAKLIVTGASRDQALERSRRALAEFEVGGMPTVLPFHRAVVRHPAFTSEPFTVHTRWIETEFDGDLPPYAPSDTEAGPDTAGWRAARRARPPPPGSGSPSRSAASGWKWYSRPGWVLAARPARAGRRPPRGARPGPGARAAAARAAPVPAPRTATRWSARCRAPSSRSSRRMASR